MASEASGRFGKPPLVVEAVQVSRDRKGAYQGDYPCPRCRSPLASKDETLLGTDTCPNCKVEFMFGAEVQTAYRQHKVSLERKEAEKQMVAEGRKRVEAEKAQIAEAERQRMADEERAYVLKVRADSEAYERSRGKQLAIDRINVNNVEFWVGLLTILSSIGSIFLVILGLVNVSSDDPFRNRAGETEILSGFSALVSVLLVYGLFRCLFAIHQLLTDISAKLDEDRAKG